MSRGLYVLGLIGILLGGFLLRVYKLDGNSCEWLYLLNLDEGHYSYNTRNRLLYGEWFVDEAKYALVAPLFSATQYVFAEITDQWPMAVRLRVISVVFGIFACAISAFFVEGWIMRLAAVFFQTISFIYVVHSRMAIPEMMLIFFLQLAIVLACRALDRNSFKWSVGAGLIALACMLIKLNGVLILPILFLGPKLAGWNFSEVKRYIFGIFVGLLLGSAVWLALLGIPHGTDLPNWLFIRLDAAFDVYAILLSPAPLIRSLVDFVLSPAFMSHPIFWALSLCWLIRLGARRLSHSRPPPNIMDAFLFLWFVLGAAVLAPSVYQPARWLFVIFPPIMIGALRFIESNPDKMWWRTAMALTLGFVLSYSFDKRGQFLENEVRFNPAFGLFNHLGITAIVMFILAGAFLICKKLTGNVKQALAIALLATELGIQLLFHWTLLRPSYNLPGQWSNVAQDIEKLMPDTGLLSGDMVQNVGLYTSRRILPTFLLLDDSDDTSIRNFYRKQSCQPTHLLIVDFRCDEMSKKGSSFMSHLRFLSGYPRYTGGGYYNTFFLFEVDPHGWSDALG